MQIPYARHYNLRLVYLLLHFSVQLTLHTDNLCTKQGNLDLKSAVYNQERVKMARVNKGLLLAQFYALSAKAPIAYALP